MIGLYRELRRRGVLGLNARNGTYILPSNDRRHYPLVDDKLRTKRLALEAGMPVPELYGEIATEREIKRLGEMLEPHEAFVIKPACGSGGDGIVVVQGRMYGRRTQFRQASGALVSLETLQHHVSNMLNGQFSLGGHPDRAMIEYCVHFDPVFDDVCFQGVPDVRVIVYRGFPVMAMLRLPTRQSGGRANLHQGAIGAGIDVASGHTLRGVLGTEVVDQHPDTGRAIAGVAIPEWDFLMRSAARCAELTGLGYLGVDMVLDRELGPLILELNARPGLNIQIANGRGLALRLEHVEAAAPADADAERRVQWSMEAFAHDGGR